MKTTMIRSAALALLLAAPTLAQDTKTAKEFAEALAAWQLEAATNGAETEALATLREELQKAVLAAPEDEALFEALVEVEAAWITRQIAVGETAQIASEVRVAEADLFGLELALTSVEAAVATAEGGDAGPLEKARARAAGVPAVRKRLEERARKRKAAAPKTPAQVDAALRTAIEEALGAGNVEFVQGLGERAIAPLVALAEESDGRPRPAGALSPLEGLMEVDPVAGLDLALRLSAEPDLLVRREVAAALARGFGDGRAWTVVEVGADEPRNPEWARIFTTLAEAPAVDPRTLRDALNHMIGRGWMPEDLFELALRAGAGIETDGADHRAPSMRAFWEFVLKQRSGKDARLAHQFFIHSEDRTPLYSLADSPHTEDRQSAESALTVTGYQHYDGTWDHRYVPSVDRAYEDALVRLALRRPLDSKELMGWPLGVIKVDPERSLSLDAMKRLTEAGVQLDRLLEYAVHLEGNEEVEAVDVVLAEAGPIEGLEGANAILAHVPVARAEPDTVWRLLDAMSGIEPNEELLWNESVFVGNSLGAHPETFPDVLRWVEELSAVPEAKSLFTPEGRGVSRISSLILNAESQMEGAQRDAFLIAAARVPGVDLGHFRRVQEYAPWGRIAVSPETTPANRSAAFDAVTMMQNNHSAMDRLQATPAEWTDGAFRLAHSAESTNDRRLDMEVLASLGVDVDVLRLRILEDETLPREARLEALDDRRPTIQDRAIAEYVLEALPPGSFDRNAPYDIVLAALHSEAFTQEDRARIWPAYAQAGPRKLREAIVESRHLLGPAESVVVLAAALEGGLHDTTFRNAVGHLGGIGSDAATEVLLSAARDPGQNAEERAFALAQVEALIAVREAEARWRAVSGGQRNGAEAVVSLIATLEADGSTVEQRREAVRGLGLLGATTELPRLIALLGDAELGAAAREAIDALHAEGQ